MYYVLSLYSISYPTIVGEPFLIINDAAQFFSFPKV